MMSIYDGTFWHFKSISRISCHYYNTTASASGNFYVNSSDLDIDYINCNSQRISSKKHSANYFLIFWIQNIDTPTLIKKVKLAKNVEKKILAY